MKRILVIDDDDQYRYTVASILKDAGFIVSDASSGEEAVLMVQGDSFDLVVSDVVMEKMDGFGLIERLRMDAASGRVPFVFMTGQSDKETMRKGMTLGADDFLVKPFSSEELLAAVEARLVRQRAVVEDSERKLAQLRSCISLALPHEVRTPLHGILGSADILTDDASVLSPAEVARFGKLIQRAGRRLEHLLENFLTYARIESISSDQPTLASLRSVVVSGTADTVESSCRKVADAYKRSGDLRLELQKSPVAVGQESFQKIVQELVDNAFKFSPPGSKVLVRSGTARGEYVLAVVDHGRGLTHQEMIDVGGYVQFGRKLHEQQGAGLGLAIATRLVEIHGGRTSFSTTAGGGLTVEVVLPSTTRAAGATGIPNGLH